MLLIEDGLLFDVNVITLGSRLALRHLDIVPHFALETNIGHQPTSGFGVNARQVAGIRVAIGIATLHVKQQDKVVTVLKGHAYSP